MSVGWLVCHILEFFTAPALLSGLDCRVSSLVYHCPYPLACNIGSRVSGLNTAEAAAVVIAVMAIVTVRLLVGRSARWSIGHT